MPCCASSAEESNGGGGESEETDQASTQRHGATETNCQKRPVSCRCRPGHRPGRASGGIGGPCHNPPKLDPCRRRCSVSLCLCVSVLTLGPFPPSLPSPDLRLLRPSHSSFPPSPYNAIMTSSQLKMRCQRCGAQMEMRDPAQGAEWKPDQFWVCPLCGRHFWTTYASAPKPAQPSEKTDGAAAPPAPVEGTASK